jgi:membrane-bound ClpP family serine protease
MDPIVLWTIGFAVAAAVLFTLEIVIPSGGLLGMLSMASLIGMIVCLFLIDATYGWVGLVASLFIVPGAIAIAMKMFPHTPIGKRLILGGNDGPRAEVRYSSDDEDNDKLVGCEGVVVSELRPVGVCNIDGQRIECLSERGTLETGTKVKVVSASGLEIKVRPI